MQIDGDGVIDLRVLDVQGRPLGVVVDVYDDPVTRRPAWLAVATGFFGTLLRVVPIRGAARRGDAVVVAHDRHTIASAPPVDVVVTIHPTQHQRLLDHYHRRGPAVAPDPHPTNHQETSP